MSDARELNKAIAAHGTWKVRIHDAIESGSSDFNPEIVKLDNACDFGKWLYSLPREEQAGEFWRDVKGIHAKFHETAAKILKLAVEGKPQEALVLMTDMKGEYVTSSILLTTTLQKWKETVS